MGRYFLIVWPASYLQLTLATTIQLLLVLHLCRRWGRPSNSNSALILSSWLAFLLSPSPAVAGKKEACCFNSTEITNLELCNWLESSGQYLRDPCTCNLMACNLTYFNSTSISVPQTTLQACWNSDATLFSTSQFCCDGQCTFLWGFNAPEPTPCCYVAQGQPTCSSELLSPVACAQQFQGTPTSSCSLCVLPGACQTGLVACSDDVSLPACPLQPLASGDSALAQFQGLGGWTPNSTCLEQQAPQVASEVVFEFFASSDCTGPSVVAGRRSLGPSSSSDQQQQQQLVVWNVSLTYQTLPLWWFPPGWPVLPVACVRLDGGPGLVVVAGSPRLSVLFRPQIPLSKLRLPWILASLLLVALLSLALAIVAEWRWRWLRDHGQPTASLIRSLSLVCWLNFLRTLLLPVLLRHDLASWVVVGGWLAAALLAVVADLAFWVFVALFAQKVQQERFSYTKELWNTRRFLLTQILPPLLVVLASFGIIVISITGHYLKLLGGPWGVSLAFLGTIALNLAPAYVALRLAFLVRYTMRVLPFRPTRFRISASIMFQ